MAGFVPVVPLLDVEQLKNLDAKQLEILRDALRNEIRTNPDIQYILKTRAQQVYDQLTSGPGTSV